MLAFLEDEGKSHIDLISRNLIVLDHDVHVLDPLMGREWEREGVGTPVASLQLSSAFFSSRLLVYQRSKSNPESRVAGSRATLNRVPGWRAG